MRTNVHVIGSPVATVAATAELYKRFDSDGVVPQEVNPGSVPELIRRGTEMVSATEGADMVVVVPASAVCNRAELSAALEAFFAEDPENRLVIVTDEESGDLIWADDTSPWADQVDYVRVGQLSDEAKAWYAAKA